jgi:hypothetical protein
MIFTSLKTCEKCGLLYYKTEAMIGLPYLPNEYHCKCPPEVEIVGVRKVPKFLDRIKKLLRIK